MIAEILFLTYGAILLGGTVLSIWRFSIIAPSYLRILLPIFLITGVVECSARYLVDHPNHWLYNLFLPVEYLLFAALYYFVFPSAGTKKVILAVSVLLLMFSVSNMLFIQGFHSFNTYTVLLSGLLILSWIFLYFRHLLNIKEHIELRREPMFWISSGLLLFYLGNIFVAGTINYFIEADRNVAILLLQVIKVLNIVTFTSFIVALLCRKQPMKS